MMRLPITSAQGMSFLVTALAFASLCAPPARAQETWKPEKRVEIIVESSPGSGVDRTARLIQKILQESGKIQTPVTVVNKPGASGNIAYQYLQQFQRNGHYIAMATATLLTNHILGFSPLNYSDFTPLSVLYGEYIGFAVSADGPIKTGKDLIERMKRDPNSITFAFGTSRGNANHIAIAIAMKAADIDPRRAYVVIYKASIDATTALMGGHVDVVATPISTFAPVMASGKIRVIAVAAPQRIKGQFAQVPTWREQGFDAIAPSYRMVLAPPNLDRVQVSFWDDALASLARSEAWASELSSNGWKNIYMPSNESVKYLDTQYKQYRSVLVDLDLVK